MSIVKYTLDLLNYNITPNSEELDVYNFITNNNSLIQNLINSLIISEKIGNNKRSKENRFKLELIIYIFIYTLIIKKQIQIDTNENISKSILDYLEEFKIDCVKEALICNNVGISFDVILLQLGIVNLDGGLGSMTIQNNNFNNIFTVY